MHMKFFFLLILCFCNFFLQAQIIYESPVGFTFTFNKSWKRLPKETMIQKHSQIKDFIEYRKDVYFDACYQKSVNPDFGYPYMLFKNIYETTNDEELIKKITTHFTNKSNIDKVLQIIKNEKIEMKINKSYYDEKKKLLFFVFDMSINNKSDFILLYSFCFGKNACIQVLSYSTKEKFKDDQKEFLEIIYSIKDKGMNTSMDTYLEKQKLAVKYYNKGKEESDLGNKEEAILYFTKAIENYPEEDKQMKSEAYFNRALNKRYMNNLQGALDDYTEAIKLRPDYYKAYHNRGYVRFLRKEYKLAIADFNQTIKFDNDNTEFTNMALGNRGISKLLLGQNGCDDLQKAIKKGNKAVIKVYNEFCL